MKRRHFFIACSFFAVLQAYGQPGKPSALTDTTVYDYEEIFSELDALIDSINRPRSFWVANLSASRSFFQYNNGLNNTSTSVAKLVFSPAIGFYHQTGVGIAGSASFLSGESFRPWQSSLTGSYDYLRHKNFVTGLSFTHYALKKDLPFYTSPLQNEAFTYFTYRNHWLKPSLSASYGWGSRMAVERRQELIRRIKRARRNNGSSSGTVTTVSTSYEKIADLNLQVSVRHDFYFLHLFSQRDYARLTPQLSFAAGSQQFGFNSTVNTTFTARRNERNNITTTQKFVLDDQLHFRPLSLTAQVRTEYSIGGFFIQPQLFLDYYFPAQTNPFTTTFFLNTGIIF